MRVAVGGSRDEPRAVQNGGGNSCTAAADRLSPAWSRPGPERSAASRERKHPARGPGWSGTFVYKKLTESSESRETLCARFKTEAGICPLSQPPSYGSLVSAGRFVSTPRESGLFFECSSARFEALSVSAWATRALKPVRLTGTASVRDQISAIRRVGSLPRCAAGLARRPRRRGGAFKRASRHSGGKQK